MVKKILVYGVRALLEGLSSIVIGIAIFIFIKGYNRIGISKCFMLSIVFLSIYIVLRFLATRRRNVKNAEELNARYGEVAKLTKGHMIFVTAWQIAATLALYICCFASSYFYSINYPHAYDVLINMEGASNNTVVLIESMPTWYGEKIIDNAEVLYSCSQFMSRSDLTDAAKRDLINKETKEFEDRSHKYTTNLIICLIALFTSGFFSAVAHTRLAYRAAIKQLDKETVK